MLGLMVAMAVQMALPDESAPAARPAEGMQGITRIFDMICNRAFPDDAKIIATMQSMPEATPLTSTQLREFLKDDPGRGWSLQAGSERVVITLEASPVHACSVRMVSDQAFDDGFWRSVIGAQQARAGGGFTPIPPRNISAEGLRTTVTGDYRLGPGDMLESFYLFQTVPTNRNKPNAHRGEIRLVRQIVLTAATP